MHSFLDNTLAFLGSQSLQIVIVVLLVYSRQSRGKKFQCTLALLVVAGCNR